MDRTVYTYTARTVGKSAKLTFTIEVIGEGGPPDPPVDEPLDVNGDGQVTVIDLVAVAPVLWDAGVRRHRFPPRGRQCRWRCEHIGTSPLSLKALMLPAVVSMGFLLKRWKQHW